MPHFNMTPLKDSSVLELFRQRDTLNLDPPYQRLSIWDRGKKERFIDSVINGFDVPKLYFHRLAYSNGGSSNYGGRGYRYSVIDGKQRLIALRDFMSGNIVLPQDFEFFNDISIKAAGAKYADLLLDFPTLRARFDGYNLPVTLVDADDPDFIEQLFWRLNEQLQLTAPERRNAFGAPLPYAIRTIAVAKFFRETGSRLQNDRLRHYDIAAKFLYIIHSNSVVSTKREALDNFVREFHDRHIAGDNGQLDKAVNNMTTTTQDVLEEMSTFFEDDDHLLMRVGRVTLYFHLFRIHRKLSRAVDFTRSMLIQFDGEVGAARAKANRRAGGADETMSDRELYLREFDRHKQSPNDAGALKQQYVYFKRYLKETFEVELPDVD